MKHKPQKVVNTGKVGQVATRKGKASPMPSGAISRLDKTTVGSAEGILKKHFK